MVGHPLCGACGGLGEDWGSDQSEAGGGVRRKTRDKDKPCIKRGGNEQRKLGKSHLARLEGTSGRQEGVR